MKKLLLTLGALTLGLSPGASQTPHPPSTAGPPAGFTQYPVPPYTCDQSAASGVSPAYYDTTLKTVQVCDGSGWKPLAVVVDVRGFGATCDDNADDTLGIQAAIDAIGSTATAQRTGSSPIVLIPGPCRITNTLRVRRKSVVIQGTGWGLRNTTPNRAFLRWDGPAGIPMLMVQDAMNCHVRNLRFIGKSTAKPSAALNFNETNDGWPLTANSIEDVYIGPFAGEPDSGKLVTDGVRLDGWPNNNAELLMTNLKVDGAARDCLHIGSIQSVDISLHGAYFSDCGRAAIYNSGYIVGTNVGFANNAVDIMMRALDDQGASAQARTQINGYFSEAAGRMCEMSTSHLILNGTSFSLTPSLNPDGKVIKAEGNTAATVILRDLRFFPSGGVPAPPYLALSPGSSGVRHVVIDGVTGWASLTGGTNGMDLSTTGNSARAYVYFRDNPQTGSILPVREARNFISGRSGLQWDVTRFDVLNNTANRLFDDFTGRAIDSNQWAGHIGSDGACVKPTVVAGTSGVCRLTTGANAGGTMALNGSQLDSGLAWSINSGPLVFEARVKLSAITNVAVFVGLTDQTAALEMPFTLGASDTLTSNATDAVGFLFDTGADTDNWWLVGVANHAEATQQNARVAPVAGAYETLRIELGGSTAIFYRNGAVIGSAMVNAVGGALLTPVVAAFSRGAASRNIDGDYIMVQSLR